NIGCPSDRVQSGRFGACLMADADLVARCVGSIADAVDLPVTVKCRIGIDDKDSDDYLMNFVETVAAAGCETFIIHARIAILKGLSPKQNREVPPLNYPRVYRLKERFPQLRVVLNGGIRTLEEGLQILDHVDGIMVGREAYQNPWILQQVDPHFFGMEAAYATRVEVLKAFLPYVEAQ